MSRGLEQGTGVCGLRRLDAVTFARLRGELHDLAFH